MAKYILLSYEGEKFFALNQTGQTFTLTLEKTNLFGYKTKVKTKVIIPDHKSSQQYFDLWNRQIKNKTPIK